MLLAARAVAAGPFRAAIGSSAEVIEVSTMATALAALREKPPVDLICCTLYFDDSRMFDLLAWVRNERPDIPFVCGRALAKDLSQSAVETARIAAENRGAATFVDYPSLVQDLGEAPAQRRLRNLLLGDLKVG